LNSKDANQNEAKQVIVIEAEVGQIHGYMIAEEQTEHVKSDYIDTNQTRIEIY
jgi:hypothetical protein